MGGTDAIVGEAGVAAVAAVDSVGSGGGVRGYDSRRGGEGVDDEDGDGKVEGGCTHSSCEIMQLWGW